MVNMWATRFDFRIKSADVSTYSLWPMAHKEGIRMSAEGTTEVELFQHRTGVPESLGGPVAKKG